MENELDESVNSRTTSLGSFKELGPLDLVHLVKNSSKSSKPIGTYYYASCIDTSSSAAVAAYLNTLISTLGEEQHWLNRTAHWKIQTAICCSYNAFSRVDVRVLVKIPGSVEAYIVDDRGDKRPATDEIWTETYLSAMIRSLLFADNENYSFITCWRRLNPLQNPELTERFFEAFETLFFRGPSLGCVSEIQNSTIVSNYLVDAFLKFVKITGKYEQALQVLSRLAKIDSDVQAITARVMLQNNDEVKAIQVMVNGILANPRDYNLLELQADYCTGKGKLDWALDCAIRAVNSAPAEFLPWARLVRIYTKMGNYEQALLTLNSCPMSTAKELDLTKMPQPQSVHFPLPSDGIMKDIWTDDKPESVASFDQSLMKLPAPTLKSTFAKAYELLTEIVSHIGWDALLKYRSNVFVMEDEYRKEKRVVHNNSIGTLKSENGVLAKPKETKEKKIADEEDEESLRQKEEEEADKMKTKRLCERWLDNLFMVLYEDLRVYTVWRAEYVHYQSQQMEYKKHSLDWEALGMVAWRLHHEDEAADAFNHSISQRFSNRIMWKLLEYYEHKGDNANILDTVVKLFAWNHRWYNEFSPKLITALRNLVASEGATKIASKIEARYAPESIVELMESALKDLTTFKAIGTDS